VRSRSPWSRSGRYALLDAYCGAGSASAGYEAAGFQVVGVDIAPQPNYCANTGDNRVWADRVQFIQAEAISFIRNHGHEFDAIHASPPCQASSSMTKGNRARGWTDQHVDLIAETRDALMGTGRPWVLENVPGASMRRDLWLCAEMFPGPVGTGCVSTTTGPDGYRRYTAARLLRHRWFELHGFTSAQPSHLPHRGRVAGWRHGQRHDGPYLAVYGDGGGKGSLDEWRDAMDMPWAQTRHEISEAIPRTYTDRIGGDLHRAVAAEYRGCTVAELLHRWGPTLHPDPAAGQLALMGEVAA
jgi:hypothetical protein